MSKLLSISLNWTPEYIRPLVVDELLSHFGKDWLRFSYHQWFIFTASPKLHIYERLRAFLPGDVQFIIVEVAPGAANGMASQWIWEWMNSRMNQQLRLPPPTS